MRRTLLLVSLGAAMLLHGCAAVIPVGLSMVGGIAAQGSFNKSVAERQADKCYQVETDARAAGKKGAELRRVQMAAQCPVTTN